MRRVFVVVPGLMNTVGHEFEYTRSVAQAFKRRGYAVFILGGRDSLPEVSTLERYSPVFRQINPNGHLKTWPWEVLRQSFFFLRELHKILSSLVFEEDDLIFVPTIPVPCFAGWVWSLAWFGFRLPKTILFFRYSLKVIGQTRYPALRLFLYPLGYKFLFWITNLLPSKPILVSDSEDLLWEYKLYTRLPFFIVPIPLVPSEVERGFASAGGSHNNDKIVRIIYLGDARWGKGFDLLPLLVEKLRNRHSRDFQLIVHCGRPLSLVSDAGIKNAYLRLQSLAGKDDLLITEKSNLPLSEYYRLLCSSNIVLLPYRKESYLRQTSNVLVEAFMAGKPVIAPDETWLGNQVLSSGAGLVFKSGEVTSLVAAVNEAIEKLSQYTDRAFHQKNYFIGYHNADNLVKEIERIIIDHEKNNLRYICRFIR